MNASGAGDVHDEDSTIYLFGSELYCGWCLESFTCPVRLKIHCHIEHLATCSCGEQFNDKQSLGKHVAGSGCLLPLPFKWSHFLNLPYIKLNEVRVAQTDEDGKRRQSVEENETNRSVKVSSKIVPKTIAAVNRKPHIKKQKQKGNKHTVTQKKYCCALCPFRSLHCSSLYRHMQRTHRNVVKNWSDTASNKSEGFITTNKDAAMSTLSTASAINEATIEMTTDGNVNPTAASSGSCCEKHRSDIQFVVSCLSSAVGDKPLSCDLCGDKFVELEEAALHIYDAHFSALQQWRDGNADISVAQPLKENSSDEKLADAAADVQLEKVSDKCDIPESHNGTFNGKMQLNVSEDSSVNLEHNTGSTSVDNHTENKTKHKFTADECKVLASSLCRLLNCSNGVTEPEVPDGKAVDIHSAKDVATVTSVSPSKKLPPASLSVPKKMSSREMVASKQLISRKCKFCHRVCSTTYNCRRHEAVCCQMLTSSTSGIQNKRSLRAMQLISQKCRYCHRVLSSKYKCRHHESICRHRIQMTSKSGTQTKHSVVHHQTSVSASVVGLHKIHDRNLFYCTRCGFSDCDQNVVSAHMIEPHITINGKLHMKRKPEHDFIRSMRVSRCNFMCKFCGVHVSFRSKMLRHLYTHSSPAAWPMSMSTAKVESPSHIVEEKMDKHDYGFASASCSKSCPKCFRSFPSIAKYLGHRATCQAVQDRKAIQQRTDRVGKLSKFCKQASDGLWKCTLCEHVVGLTHRYNLYRHIRQKHNEVLNRKRVASSEFIIKISDGQWQCTLCKLMSKFRQNLNRHVQIQHADRLNQKLETPKQKQDITKYCVQTLRGRWQCILCKHVTDYRSYLLRHIQSTHKELLVAESTKSSPGSSLASVSLPSARKLSVKTTAIVGVQQKSRAKRCVKLCPYCSRVFTSTGGYSIHLKLCGRLGLDRFVEIMPSGRARCRFCHVTYSCDKSCRGHIRQKHLSSGELKTLSREGAEAVVKTEKPEPTDDSVSANDVNKECSYDGIPDSDANVTVKSEELMPDL